MAKRELPKVGNRIPVEKFHVSPLNVRADEPFGESEEDQALIANLRRGRIIGPFKARPERNGYGVVVGRRRFLAKKATEAKSFVVGVDCLIEDMGEQEAREASLVENLDALRKSMNPIARAKQLNELIAHSTSSLRATAKRLGVPASNLSDWLKMLELTEKMQDAVAKGLLGYTDALKLARLHLGKAKQDELADVLETEGPDAFWSELAKVTVGRRRGIPRGKYIILRATFDKRYKPDLELYEKLSKLAEAKGMKVDEYCKWVLTEHAKTA